MSLSVTYLFTVAHAQTVLVFTGLRIHHSTHYSVEFTQACPNLTPSYIHYHSPVTKLSHGQERESWAEPGNEAWVYIFYTKHLKVSSLS